MAKNEFEKVLRITFITDAEKAEEKIRALAQASRDQIRSQKEVVKALDELARKNKQASKSTEEKTKASKDTAQASAEVTKESKTVVQQLKILVIENRHVSQAFEATGKAAEAGLTKGKVAALAVTAALVGTAYAVVKLGSDFAKSGDEIAKNARQANITAEGYQRLTHSMSLAGVESSELDTGLQRMSLGLAGIGRGTKEVTDGIAVLGLSVKDLKDLRTEEQFHAIAEAIRNSSSESDRAAATAAIFGRSNARMTAALAEGSDALKAQGDEAHRLGLVMGDETAKKAEELNDALNTTKAVAGTLTRDLGAALAPVLKDVAEGVTEWIVENRELINQGMEAVVGGLSDAVDELKDPLSEMAKETIKWIKENQDLIKQDMPKVLMGTAEAVGALARGFVTLVGAINKASDAYYRFEEAQLEQQERHQARRLGVSQGSIDAMHQRVGTRGLAGLDATQGTDATQRAIEEAQVRDIQKRIKMVQDAADNAFIKAWEDSVLKAERKASSASESGGAAAAERGRGRGRAASDPHSDIQSMLSAPGSTGEEIGMAQIWEEERRAAEAGARKLREQVLSDEKERADEVFKIRMRSVELAQAHGLSSDEALRRESDAHQESARIRQRALNVALEQEREHAEQLREQRLAELEIDRELGLEPEVAAEREREIQAEHQEMLLEGYQAYASERSAIADQMHRAEVAKIQATNVAEANLMKERERRIQQFRSTADQSMAIYSNLAGVAENAARLQGRSEADTAKAVNAARAAQAVGLGLLQTAQAAAAFASFNYVQGAAHTTAAALAFTNAALIRSESPFTSSGGVAPFSFSTPSPVAQGMDADRTGAVPISRGTSQPDSLPSTGSPGTMNQQRTVNVNINQVSTLATTDDELGLRLRQVIADSESMVGAA
jgi:hypothetical protein